MPKWGGGFDDFAECVIASSRPEEIERALRFGWYLHRVEECREFSAQEIAELFVRANISKPNVSRLGQRLANTRRTFRGSTQGRFRLTAAALDEFDDEFKGAFEEPMDPSHGASERLASRLSDLDELVQSFVSEAVGCLRVGHLRAAVVLSWVGAIGVLQHHVVRNHLEKFNADAKAIGFIKREAHTVSDLSKIKESEFLDMAERIGVLSGAVKKELKSCLDRRNNCGHPNDYIITPAMTVAHVESLLVHVFERY